MCSKNPAIANRPSVGRRWKKMQGNQSLQICELPSTRWEFGKKKKKSDTVIPSKQQDSNSHRPSWRFTVISKDVNYTHSMLLKATGKYSTLYEEFHTSISVHHPRKRLWISRQSYNASRASCSGHWINEQAERNVFVCVFVFSSSSEKQAQELRTSTRQDGLNSMPLH